MTRSPLLRHRLVLLPILSALALPLPAVAAEAPKLAAAPAPALTLSPTDDPVVARINGEELRKSDLVAAQAQLPAQMRSVPLDSIYPQLLEQMVNNRLLTDAGRAEKLADDPEVKEQIARLLDRVIERIYIERLVSTAVTDDQLHALYQKQVKDAPAKEEIKARHILVDSEADAKAIIAQLDKGADFAKLATEKNKPGAAGEGGDLGWFTDGQMVPEFSAAAFKLKKGEYTKAPVKTQYGWHVIKVEDRRAGQPPSFEESKEALADTLERQVIDAKVADLRTKAKVEEFSLDGKPLAPPSPHH